MGSSWIRNGTCLPYIGRQILNHRTTREVLDGTILIHKLFSSVLCKSITLISGITILFSRCFREERRARCWLYLQEACGLLGKLILGYLYSSHPWVCDLGDPCIPSQAITCWPCPHIFSIFTCELLGGCLCVNSSPLNLRSTRISLFTFMHWRRKWQPTPVFLPGESQWRGSLVGCCLWGCTESDTTEVT